MPERVFTFGISATSYNFTKVVEGDYFEKEVFALIKADINLQNAKDVMSVVADAISKAGINVEQTEDGGITLGKDEYYKSIIDRAEKNLWRKIEVITAGAVSVPPRINPII